MRWIVNLLAALALMSLSFCSFGTAASAAPPGSPSQGLAAQARAAAVTNAANLATATSNIATNTSAINANTSSIAIATANLAANVPLSRLIGTFGNSRDQHSSIVGASGTASFSGNVMTVTAASSGYFSIGQNINSSGLPGYNATAITGQPTITGSSRNGASCGGSACTGVGGTGTYLMSYTVGSAISAQAVATNGNWNTTEKYGNRLIAFGYLPWLRGLSGQAFDVSGPCMGGEVGDKSADYVTRLPAYLAACAAPVIEYGAADPINDLGSANVPLATIEANVAQGIALARAQNRILLIRVPLSAGGTTVTTNRLSAANLAKYNAYVRWLIETYGSTPGIKLLDGRTGTLDATSTTGDLIAGTAYDDLHPAPNGAYLEAVQWLSTLTGLGYTPRSFAPGSNSDLYDATNNPQGAVIANPMLTGSGGTAGTQGSGTIAASWSGGNAAGDTSGVTRTYSQVTTTFRGMSAPAQRIVLSGTAASTGDQSLLFQNVPTANIAFGDTVRAACEINVTSPTKIATIFLKLTDTSDFTIAAADMDYSGAFGYLPTASYTMTLLTPPATLKSTSLRVTLGARQINGDAVSATVDARFCTVFKTTGAS